MNETKDENVIDLNAKRNEREQPDADCVRKDEYGRKLFMFTLGWKRGDDSFGIELWAYSEEDAQKHVAAMRESLTYDGQVYTIIPA
jgi:hypothetical protein